MADSGTAEPHLPSADVHEVAGISVKIAENLPKEAAETLDKLLSSLIFKKDDRYFVKLEEEIQGESWSAKYIELSKPTLSYDSEFLGEAEALNEKIEWKASAFLGDAALRAFDATGKYCAKWTDVQIGALVHTRKAEGKVLYDAPPYKCFSFPSLAGLQVWTDDEKASFEPINP